MTVLVPWFERKFAPVAKELFPNLIERLRSTPASLEDRAASLLRERLIYRQAEKWSVQEQVGHLLDLEPLWAARLDNFVNGDELLAVADLSNRKTHEANHNAVPLERLLSDFRNQRKNFVERLEKLEDAVISREALHPRLKLPMTLPDHMYFLAEHDMHHLAQISKLLQLAHSA
jgi:uncharacterized damage-inducible protein DinB